jgi:hypothetical protein
MSHVDSPALAAARPRGGFRIWHYAVLIVFIAIAITDVQHQHIHDARLLALASGGFALYGLIAAIAWFYVQHFESKIGRSALLIAYCVGMGAFFLFATVCYLMIEYAIVTGHR